MMGTNNLWFMDAYSQSGGNIPKTASLIADKMWALPVKQQPEWMKGRHESKVHQIILDSIWEAIDATLYVQTFMDKEVSKGRSYEDAFDEMRPVIDKVSEPVKTLEQECEIKMSRHEPVPPTPERRPSISSLVSEPIKRERRPSISSLVSEPIKRERRPSIDSTASEFFSRERRPSVDSTASELIQRERRPSIDSMDSDFSEPIKRERRPSIDSAASEFIQRERRPSIDSTISEPIKRQRRPSIDNGKWPNIINLSEPIKCKTRSSIDSAASTRLSIDSAASTCWPSEKTDATDDFENVHTMAVKTYPTLEELVQRLGPKREVRAFIGNTSEPVKIQDQKCKVGGQPDDIIDIKKSQINHEFEEPALKKGPMHFLGQWDIDPNSTDDQYSSTTPSAPRLGPKLGGKSLGRE